MRKLNVEQELGVFDIPKVGRRTIYFMNTYQNCTLYYYRDRGNKVFMEEDEVDACDDARYDTLVEAAVAYGNEVTPVIAEQCRQLKELDMPGVNTVVDWYEGVIQDRDHLASIDVFKDVMGDNSDLEPVYRLIHHLWKRFILEPQESQEYIEGLKNG